MDRLIVTIDTRTIVKQIGGCECKCREVKLILSLISRASCHLLSYFDASK